jgi:Family of unknown function (DUF6159)
MSSSSRRRSRAILRAAWQTLRRNPRLLWFSALLGVASLVLTSIGATLGWLGLQAVPWLADHGFAEPPEPSLSGRAAIGVGLFLWFGAHLLAPYFGVALSSATLEALASRPFRIRSCLREANRRLGGIATFAVLDASVGAFLARMRGGSSAQGRRRSRGSPLAAKLLGFAWRSATYLVVPVLSRESKGGLAALGRSTALMRQTWREAFVGRLVLGWVLWPAALLALGALTVLVMLGVSPLGQPVLFGVTAGLSVIAWVGLAVIAHTLDTIYRCALYVFATEGVVPEPFADPDLDEIWAVRREP